MKITQFSTTVFRNVFVRILACSNTVGDDFKISLTFHSVKVLWTSLLVYYAERKSQCLIKIIYFSNYFFG